MIVYTHSLEFNETENTKQENTKEENFYKILMPVCIYQCFNLIDFIYHWKPEICETENVVLMLSSGLVYHCGGTWLDWTSDSAVEVSVIFIS